MAQGEGERPFGRSARRSRRAIREDHHAAYRRADFKRRIDQAAKYVPLERLALSPQCGFASTHHGTLVTEDDQRRKLDLVVDVADDVWGNA